MNVYLVINKILQLFMMIVLGFILGKMKDFDESFIDKMNRFVLNITMPCLIISSVSANKNGIPYQDLFFINDYFNYYITYFCLFVFENKFFKR